MSGDSAARPNTNLDESHQSSKSCFRPNVALMALLRDAPDDFAALVDRVSQQLDYPPAFVERDYWITEILRSIAKPIPDVDARIVFKGGTSLSKGWRLIQRMSEDVDVIVVFGDSATIGDRNRVLRHLIDRTSADTGLVPTGQTGRDGVHRARTFEYPQSYAHGALSGTRVLLELGTRGGPEPQRRLSLRSYVAEVAVDVFKIPPHEFDEFAPLEIDTLEPERTLLEKLAALHTLASQAAADPNALANLGTKMRHAYDIAMLLGHQETVTALRGLDLAGMLADIERRTIASDWEWTPRPAGGYSDSPAFQDAFIAHASVIRAYDQALALVVGGSKPSLREIVELVRSHGDLL